MRHTSITNLHTSIKIKAKRASSRGIAIILTETEKAPAVPARAAATRSWVFMVAAVKSIKSGGHNKIISTTGEWRELTT